MDWNQGSLFIEDQGTRPLCMKPGSWSTNLKISSSQITVPSWQVFGIIGLLASELHYNVVMQTGILHLFYSSLHLCDQSRSCWNPVEYRSWQPDIVVFLKCLIQCFQSAYSCARMWETNGSVAKVHTQSSLMTSAVNTVYINDRWSFRKNFNAIGSMLINKVTNKTMLNYHRPS